jgi:hypothetical protein
MSKINFLLTCNRDELPISVDNVRMILIVLMVIVSEFQIMESILINNSLWESNSTGFGGNISMYGSHERIERGLM